MIESVRVRPLSEASDLARPKSVTLGVAVGGQQDVGRLQVAMDDALAVGLGDAARHGFDQLGGPLRRPGRAVETPVQAAAVDVLQLEERQAVGLADVVDLHDVGVLQPGDGLRFGQEADGGLDAGMGAGQDHLQDAWSVQEDLSAAVDDAHAAAAQLAQDLVAGDGGDDAVGRRRGGTAVAPGVGVEQEPDRRVERLCGAGGRLGPGALATGILESREGHDAVAGGPDDRSIEEATLLVVSPQERLDPLPQLRIGRALTIQGVSPVRVVVAFDDRTKHGLDAFRVERHRMVLETASPFRTRSADARS